MTNVHTDVLSVIENDVLYKNVYISDVLTNDTHVSSVSDANFLTNVSASKENCINDGAINSILSINDAYDTVTSVNSNDDCLMNCNIPPHNVTEILTEHVNSQDENTANDLDPFKTLANFSKLNSKRITFSHLNINSLANKFMDINEILKNGLNSILFLSETKIDSSFPNAQFNVSNYCIHRQDRNTHGGGLLCYVHQMLPHRNRHDIAVNNNGIESLVIHVKLSGYNLFFICIYKPPNINNDHLKHAIDDMMTKCNLESEYIYIIGDMNVNFMNKNNVLIDTLNSFDLKQMIKEPTCYKSLQNPTLLDIILTNKPKSITKTVNITLGISDFHNYIAAAIKMPRPDEERRMITYRSLKNFNEKTYQNDLEIAPFHVAQIFEEADDQLWFHNKLLLDVIEQNAPLKQRLVKCKQLPYMNDTLRKAINVKAALRRKHQSIKSQQSWINFKRQRNLVNKLKRTSFRKYFEKNCNSSNNRHFWDVIKPFITDKSKSNNQNIMLYENNSLISDPQQVADNFNEYFINITNDSCEPENINDMKITEIVNHYSDHPSIKLIKEKSNHDETFSFQLIHPNDINGKLKNLKSKKSCGFDNIQPKFLKIGADALSWTLAPIINKSIISHQYPDYAKRAVVSPLFKKSDQLDKANYRPVSILTSTSKIFEGVLCEQVNAYMSHFLNKDLAAYRKHYSCNNVLINCIETWRSALDRNEKVGCLLIDLSKAFDSLPHGLLIAKLHAYGFSNESCEYILQYLSQRKQAIKIGNTIGNWQTLKTGVPQGSLTGPLLFNIFINDFMLQLEDICKVYNYADDNTLSFSHTDLNVIKAQLEHASEIAITWFSKNYMKANPSKFQAICFSKDDNSFDLDICDFSIKTEKCVKLLGIELDNKLSFTQHVTNVCKKAARQVNALYRISKNLNYDTKMKIYDSFIMSNFIYCSAAYNNFNITNDRKIEKINKRALRLVCNDYTCTYNELLKMTGKYMLYVYRKFHVIEHVYKTLNRLALPIEPNFFERLTTNYNLRDDYKLKQPRFNTITYGYRSIACQGPILWNNLPNDIKHVADFQDFKSLIRKCSLLVNCECGSCLLCLKDNV